MYLQFAPFTIPIHEAGVDFLSASDKPRPKLYWAKTEQAQTGSWSQAYWTMNTTSLNLTIGREGTKVTKWSCEKTADDWRRTSEPEACSRSRNGM